MLNTITGYHNGFALIRTKSIPEEKEQSSIDRAREAVERQRKGEKPPVLTKAQQRKVDDAMRKIVEGDRVIDKRERRRK